MDEYDYKRALDALRSAVRSINEFCDIMEPHADDPYYRMDGLYLLRFKDDFNFDLMREHAYAMSEDADTLADYISDLDEKASRDPYDGLYCDFELDLW